MHAHIHIYLYIINFIYPCTIYIHKYTHACFDIDIYPRICMHILTLKIKLVTFIRLLEVKGSSSYLHFISFLYLSV